jgi:SAM-dependent methyltransferase
MPRFGERRLVRPGSNVAERLLFRIMGVADPAHYLHNLYLRRELERLGAFNPRRILDAGCGAGDHTLYLARQYPGADVLGVDINTSRMRENRETARRLGIANARFEVADLCEADFATQYDLIVSIDVLEHIVNQTEALANLSRALRPGGLAFFHLPTIRERPVPFSQWLGGFHEWAAREHVAEERTWEGFMKAVEACGLTIVRAYRTFGYFTGELATSLFALPYAPTKPNRALLALLALPCRILARADALNLEKTRYAVAVVAQKPA